MSRYTALSVCKTVTFENVCLQEWAKYNGRYQEGTGKEPEYATWKTQLRCALHKSKAFEYVKEESNDRKESVEPFRVYLLKQRSQPEATVRGETCLNLYPFGAIEYLLHVLFISLGRRYSCL